MTDKELLELAAKAAGYEESRICIDEWFWVLNEDNDWTPWNPLTDDGDALRLAVNLRINIEHESANSVWADNEGETSEGDIYAATRRAIVRAAAEIGKNV